MPATLRRRRTKARQAETKRAFAPTSGPKSLDKVTRTVRATIATDTPVRIIDWEAGEEVDEVLIPAGMEIPDRMRLRVDHNRYRSKDVIGRVFDFEITDTAVNATLRFSRAADVQEIFDRVIDGDLDAVSVGARYSMRDTIRIEPGKSKTYNGLTYTATDVPMLLVTRWIPSETSVVDEGADPRAVIRSKRATELRTANKRKVNSTNRSRERTSRQDQHSTQGHDEMPATLRNKQKRKVTERKAASAKIRDNKGPSNARRTQRRQVARSVAADTIGGSEDPDDDDDSADDESPSEPVRSEKRADRSKQSPSKAPAPDVSNDDVIVRDRRRAAKIMELGRDMPRQLVERAISEGWSVSRAGKAFFEHLQSGSAKPVGQSGDGFERAPAGHIARGASIESLQAAVIMRSGISLQSKAFATDAAQILFERMNMSWLYEFNRDIADNGKSDAERFVEVGRRFRTDSAVRTCERILALRGKSIPDDVEMLVQRSFSISYMPRVFGALVAAGMIQGYAEFKDSTIGWVAETEWKDFRDNQPIGIDAGQGLRKHQRGTKAKEVGFTDFGDKYQLARYTGVFTMDEMDIIDDQIGANQMIPTEMGKMAARLRPDLVYAVLHTNAAMADTVALFHSSRNNLLASTGMTIDGLAAAEAKIAVQTVAAGQGKTRSLNMTAAHVVCPRTLRAKAKQVTGSTKVVTGNTTQQGDMNPHEGEYVVHSDARLDNGVVDPRIDTQVAGATDAWYLTAEIGNAPLQIGYRTGTGRAPQVRTKQLNEPGTWGLAWDVVHDIGIGVLNPRSIVKVTA